ncbi:MAG: ATP-binding cassette domain-containing protein [Acidimicrobiales bacterium]
MTRPSTPQDSPLRFQSVSYSYQTEVESKPVLNDVSFDVQPGELVGLVGRSGEGKSTLLALAGGLLATQIGLIQVAGVELAGASMAERCRVRRCHVRMVFQEAGLLAGLSVLDNVGLPLELSGVGRSASLEAATGALTQLGLAGLSSRRPSELSTGQRQRVGIARAMAGLEPQTPRVVLVDEPTASLDRASSNDVMAALQRAADAGMAVLTATHDPGVIEAMDRAMALVDGSLQPLHQHG